MQYEHQAAKLSCSQGIDRLVSALNQLSVDGWELVAFETVVLGPASGIIAAGQVAQQQEPGWFVLLRRPLPETTSPHHVAAIKQTHLDQLHAEVARLCTALRDVAEMTGDPAIQSVVALALGEA